MLFCLLRLIRFNDRHKGKNETIFLRHGHKRAKCIFAISYLRNKKNEIYMRNTNNKSETMKSHKVLRSFINSQFEKNDTLIILMEIDINNS